MSSELISLTVQIILVLCIVACAVYLGQIRDILRDIRDGKKGAQKVPPYMKR